LGVYMKLRRDLAKREALLVGLPGMGRVGYITVNYLVEKLEGVLVGEVYSTYFPSELEVDDSGLGSLVVGRIYDIGKALVFTADSQPQSPEGQNLLSKKVAEFASRKGVRMVLAAAAYVVPTVDRARRVYVVGTDRKTVEVFTSLGAIALRGGTISGINGAIVGWSRYYNIPAAVLLGETWAPLVEVGESDFRASRSVIEVVSRFLGIQVDSTELDDFATQVEKSVAAAIAKMTSRKEEPERAGHRDREVM
jgi:predicted ATP-grasp superfamily ATP-dependent carboligase